MTTPRTSAPEHGDDMSYPDVEGIIDDAGPFVYVAPFTPLPTTADGYMLRRNGTPAKCEVCGVYLTKGDIPTWSEWEICRKHRRESDIIGES